MILQEHEHDFESYLARLGERLPAGHACDRCRSVRLRSHGTYERKGFVLDGGVTAALPIRRVRCLDCGRAPSLVPAFAATGLRASSAVVEQTGARYLEPPDATYRRVAAWLGSSHSTVHRWLTRLGGVCFATLTALLLRLRPDLDPFVLFPQVVSSEGRKGRSPARIDLLRRAIGVLALGRRCAEELVRGTLAAPPSVFAVVREGFAT